MKTHFSDEFSHLNINSINFKSGSSNLKSNDLLTDPSSEINKPFIKKKTVVHDKNFSCCHCGHIFKLNGVSLVKHELTCKKKLLFPEKEIVIFNETILIMPKTKSIFATDFEDARGLL